jgi:hypothetical protein
MSAPSPSAEVELKSLRDRPFELLAELERRGRAVSAQLKDESAGGREWVGVALRMAGDLYLVAREETREVLGFRRFAETEFSGDAPPTVARCERYLAGAFRRASEQWPVLSLRSVLESPGFAEAAA